MRNYVTDTEEDIGMDTVVYKSVNGLDIHADVYPAEGAGLAPVLVWIHGGALIMGNRRCVHPALGGLCSEVGFAHVSIDYRLAPETKLPGIIEDLCDAIAWVHGAGAKHFGLDPRRVAVVGHSGGGLPRVDGRSSRKTAASRDSVVLRLR